MEFYWFRSIQAKSCRAPRHAKRRRSEHPRGWGRWALGTVLVVWVAVPAIGGVRERALNAARLRPSPGAFIVTLSDGANPGPLRGMVHSLGGSIHHEFRILPGRISVRGIPRGLETALAHMPGVQTVNPDYEVHAAMAESVPLLGALVTDFEMRHTDGGLEISVCVLDTGLNRFHAMFDDDNNVETPTNRVSAWKDFIFDILVPYDDNGHGSHVAGTIWGRTGLTLFGLPFQGMAPRGKMYVGKVLNFGGVGLFSDLHAGIEWCAGFAADSPFPPANIINMSLGAGGFVDVCDDDPTGTAQLVNAAADAGVLVVAAAGNQGNINAALTPACASGAMAIGATYDGDTGPFPFTGCTDAVTETDKLICISNRWDYLDVVAPGCRTRSAGGMGGLTLVDLCGTSMAAAHVSGLATLVMAANRTMTSAEVRERITSTALDLGNPGFDRAHGYGRVQAGTAVDVPCFPFETTEQSCDDGLDNDCDSKVDCEDVDCCGGAICGTGDADGDGFAACDCDDTNSGSWSDPGNVFDLVLTGSSGSAFIDWLAPTIPGGLTVVYDVLRSDEPNVFTGASTCLETNDGANTTAFDPDVPLPGAAYFYVVRADNDCADRLAGVSADSDGVIRAARTCP